MMFWRKGNRTASGPFKATKFFLTDSMASSGMTVRPFLSCGVTSTGSHFIGTFWSQNVFTCGEQVAYFGCSEYVLNRLRDLWPNSVSFDQSDRIFALTPCIVQLHLLRLSLLLAEGLSERSDTHI